MDAHSAGHNLFNFGRRAVNAEHYRILRVSAFAEWSKVVARGLRRGLLVSKSLLVDTSSIGKFPQLLIKGINMTLPSSAQVVIIGGGIIGCSVAYHLTELGIRDVVLLERKQLTCGTTWHAAGLVAQLRATENMTQLARYSHQLYQQLEAKTGMATGFYQCGAVTLATNKARMEEVRRGAAMARNFGLECEELSPQQAQDMWPLMQVDDVLGAFYFPQDARTNPTDTTVALAKGARMGGATILEGVCVTDLIKQQGQVRGVVTDQGEVQAEIVVNCAGMWAHHFSKQQGVTLPLHAAEHYYLVTEPLAGMNKQLPVLRDFDNHAYYREETGKLLLGLFEPDAAPWGSKAIPEHFCFDELPPDWDRLTPYISAAMERIPALANTGIQLLFNGPESFTPDDRYCLGESAELKNLFVAAGFNSVGIQSAGGAGMVLAQWIKDGRQPMDLWEVDTRRMLPFQNNRQYLYDRTKESLGLLYQMHWPFRQYESARGVRKSPLHDRLKAAGACFGETAGWERANWYADADQKAEYQYSYGQQNWFDNNAQEHFAVRNNVGLFDQSSFAKFLVSGPDSQAVLNQICANNIAVPVGKAVYTQWLNQRGTIEADLTVTKVAEDEFWVITSPATQTHIHSWLKQHSPSDARLWIHDITSAWCVLNIQGPNSRALLQQISDTDFSDQKFPFATMKNVELGYATIKALRITYMGELGWELYIPSEFVQHVYDEIIKVGEKFSLKHCGYHSLNSLRIEKAYREFGHDIGADDTPLEAGLGFAVDFTKPEGFIGKQTLLDKKQQGLKKRLVQFQLHDSSAMLYHHEPIYRNGSKVGYIASGMYGHSLGAAIGLGYIHNDQGVTADFINSGAYEIDVAGKRIAATASLKPLYDPENKRVRC